MFAVANVNPLSFYDWIDRRVDWDGETIPRSKAIRRFVRKGLMPWIETLGYRWESTREDIENRLATGLWANEKVSHAISNWKGLVPESHATQEEYWHYTHVADCEAWNLFWSHWGVWTDVNPATSFWGQDRRFDIQEFVWGQLDLDISVQTKVVNELLGIWDMDGSLSNMAHTGQGGQGGHTGHAGQTYPDVYIREAHESNQYDGHRR